MLGWRWPIVYNAGPTSAQHWANASCLLGYVGTSLEFRCWLRCCDAAVYCNGAGGRSLIRGRSRAGRCSNEKFCFGVFAGVLTLLWCGRLGVDGVAGMIGSRCVGISFCRQIVSHFFLTARKSSLALLSLFSKLLHESQIKCWSFTGKLAKWNEMKWIGL